MSELIISNNMGVIAKAELDTQISTAKAYPRNAKESVEYAIQLATMDEETAASCFYVLPRKNKDGSNKQIDGPSIRLAEIFATAWGNLHAATRIVENDGAYITTEGVAWDLQANVKFSAQHKIKMLFKDEALFAANSQAKALRNAIFKAIPRALVNRVQQQAMKFAVGELKNINAKVTELFDKLIKMGLDKEKILNYYERKSLAEITPDDFRSLIGVATAIKEGHVKIDEVFTQEDMLEDSKMSAAEKINNLVHSRRNVENENGQLV